MGKIKITLNGEPISIHPCSLLELITDHNISIETIIVEINNQIVTKANYDKTMITDKDTIEIIRYIGGGKY